MPPLPPLYEELFHTFIKRYYESELLKLSLLYPNEKSLICSFKDLDTFNPELASRLLEEPDDILDAATNALREMDLSTGIILDGAHFRVAKLPNIKRIREIRSDDVGTLITIEGVVPKVTPVGPQVIEAVFECPYCGHIFSVEQSGNQFKEPLECETESGGCGRKVQHFKMHERKSKYVNAQKIRIQDAPEELRGGELPQVIDVNLHEDLTGKVVPGDRVIVVGVLRQYQKRTQFGKTNAFQIFMDANSLELKEEVAEEVVITDEDAKRIEELRQQPDVYEKLIMSVAPSVFGYETIKEALVLQLFSAHSFYLPDGTYKRGDIHILIIGDPGVAKSVLLAAIAKLALRGILTDGTGATGRGLTASAVKDREFSGNEWTAAAGAMVLADKGLLAVDEFDKMNDDDRDKMHQALEQQKVHLTKAGLNVVLNSRCALLAAANPKYGRFDKYAPIAEQINLSPALISRFDLIFPIFDNPNEETDRRVATHIMSSYKLMDGNNDSVEAIFTPVVGRELMRKYIAVAKKIKPRVSKEADENFVGFYLSLRNQAYGEDAPVPVTARELDALVRLGQARARTRLSDVVTGEDANCVINLVMGCLKQVFVDPETGKLDVDWVIAGTSKTMRDRARIIKAIIMEFETEHGDEVPIEDVLDTAEEEGIDRDKAEEVIETMKRDGLLFSRGSGVIGLVR